MLGTGNKQLVARQAVAECWSRELIAMQEEWVTNCRYVERFQISGLKTGLNNKHTWWFSNSKVINFPKNEQIGDKVGETYVAVHHLEAL